MPIAGGRSPLDPPLGGVPGVINPLR
jgi:hypothetical protein